MDRCPRSLLKGWVIALPGQVFSRPDVLACLESGIKSFNCRPDTLLGPGTAFAVAWFLTFFLLDYADTKVSWLIVLTLVYARFIPAGAALTSIFTHMLTWECGARGLSPNVRSRSKAAAVTPALSPTIPRLSCVVSFSVVWIICFGSICFHSCHRVDTSLYPDDAKIHLLAWILCLRLLNVSLSLSLMVIPYNVKCIQAFWKPWIFFNGLNSKTDFQMDCLLFSSLFLADRYCYESNPLSPPLRSDSEVLTLVPKNVALFRNSCADDVLCWDRKIMLKQGEPLTQWD